LPAAPRELDTTLNPSYALSEEANPPLKKPAPPPGTAAPVPLLGAAPEMAGGAGEAAANVPSGGGTFAAVGPRNGLQRKVHRLTQENRELKHFILQRGKQATTAFPLVKRS